LVYGGLILATVGEVGERALIELMLRHLTPMPEMSVPFWDDVMAVSLGDGRAAVLNTDMLVWKTDIPQGMTHYQAARKAVVMNFSDLGAKGVRPQAFLASLGIPRELSVGDAEEMARGFENGAREYGGYVIGGDTNEAVDIIISGVAYGVAYEDKLVKRKGAKPGDILATTGLFGDTSAAFKILVEGYDAPGRLKDSLVKSVYMPKARVDEGVALSESGSASASIDSSDGLAVSLHDLSWSSGVGFRVERLPTSQGAKAFAGLHGLDPGDLALYGGEEYELVFTIKPGELDVARDALRGVNCELIELGRATDNKRITLVEEGREKPIGKGGWEHFKMG
jgi:thiamine-monophosphate kinase